LNQLDGDRLSWLVPGMIAEKIGWLLKTLPKESRRSLVPIPETAAKVAATIRFGEGTMTDSLVLAIERVAGVKVPRDELREDRLPYHLRMQIRVTDSKQKVLTQCRDIVQLRQQFGGAASSSFSSTSDDRWNRENVTTWSFGTIPNEIEVVRSSVVLKGYPTLIDEGVGAGSDREARGVRLQVVDTSSRATRELRFGIRRLICLAASRELKQHADHLPQLTNWTLLAKTFPQPFPFRDQIVELIADRAFLDEPGLPRTEGEFRDCLKRGRGRLGIASAEVAQVLAPLFVNFADIRKIWEKTAATQWQQTRQDVHGQLARLFVPGFLVTTPWPWLQQIPRYAKGIVVRLEKLTRGSGPRDVQLLPSVQEKWQRTFQKLDEHRQRHFYDSELETYRWMLEEYRVSLFAQELGTAIGVSEKKLDQQWSKVSN